MITYGLRSNMKNHKLTTLIILIVSLIALLSALCATTYAIVILNSTRETIQGTTIDITAEAEFTLDSNNTSITFNKAKDTDSIKTTLTNNTNAVLHYYYKLTFNDSNDLAKAVLVSHNDDFIKTLNQFTTENNTIEDEYAFVDAGKSITDNITFELHEAIKGTLLDNKTISVTLELYTKSIDYSDYMFVRTEEEYKAAIDDVNSGLLSIVPTIVLLDDVSLTDTYTLENECNLVLNSHSISGTTILNSTNAFLDIIGNNAKNVSSFNLTLTSYNETRAAEILSSLVEENLKYGVNSKTNITNFCGTLVAYNGLISTIGDNYDYLSASDTLVSYNVDKTSVEAINVGSEEKEFTIYSGTTNIDTYLLHMPSEGEIVTTDIYLPTNFSGQNATIEWTSSDLSLMDNQGKITTSSANLADITYYAKIKVNNTVYTKSYPFKISVYNNEINFNNVVSEMSPVVIYMSFNGTNQTEAYYCLPVVDNSSDYDYRKNFSSPQENPTYTWSASRDVSLKSLEYSLILDDDGNEVYDYIGIDGNAVYLKNDTLNTYAQISVKGTFETGDSYTSSVNINIAVGTKTEILEPAFKNVQEYLDDVNVLYSIISSRQESGLANEKASFLLPSCYFDENNNLNFKIEYTKSNDIVTSVELTSDGNFYEITLDPTKFSKTESTVPIAVKVSLNDSVVKERYIYFTVPAVLKTTDVGNASLFNSIKYQVFNNLPSNEKAGTTGFTISSSQIVNNTDDYILIRDIVGDKTYKTEYISNYDEGNGYLSESKLNYSEADYAKPVDTLKLYINEKTNSSTSTDTLAYDFTRLIEWATSNKKTKISDLSLNNASYVSSYTDIESDGKEYLTANEIAVLKAFYNGATGTEKWDTVYALVSEKAPGYVFSDTTKLNNAIKETINLDTVKEAQRDDLYFKYVEITQVVLEKKDHSETGYYFPNMGTIGANTTYGWDSTGAGIDDGTVYISEKELGAIKVYWEKALANTTYVSSTTSATTITTALDESVTWPEYFINGGVGKLINYFYEDAGIKVDKTDGYTAIISGGIPTVTNIDSLNAIFNYFSSLKNLEVVGNDDLSAFLETYSLSSFFNRLTVETVNLENITFKYSADNYTEMDISNIKEFDNLKTINLSNNMGLTNTAYLVNTNSGNYTSVIFQNIGVEYEFQEYAISSLSSATCTVGYTNDNGENVTTNKIYTTDKALTYLNEFDALIAENMFLVDKVYNESATDSTQIYWRIDKGNKITSIADAGKYAEINSVHDMNMMISPYYYCSKSFTFENVTFTKGKVYKITSSGTNIAISELAIDAEVVSDVSDETLKTKITEDEIKNSWTKTDKADSEKYTDTDNGSTETITTSSSDNVIFTAEPVEATYSYTLQYNCFTMSRSIRSSGGGGSGGGTTYYITATSSSNALSLSSTSTDGNKMCFLTEDEFNKIKNNSFTSEDIVNGYITLGTSSFPATSSSTTIYTQSSTSKGTAYYIYFPAIDKFLMLSNNSCQVQSIDNLSTTTANNMWWVYYRTSYYYIYNSSNTATSRNSTYFIKYSSSGYTITYSTGTGSGFSPSTVSTYAGSSGSFFSSLSTSTFSLYNGNDEEIFTMENVYQLGYDVISIENRYDYQRQYYSSEVSYTTDKYFYNNGRVYKTSYSYENNDTATITYYYTETYSTYYFYYIETKDGDRVYVDSYDVASCEYSYNSLEDYSKSVETSEITTSQNKYFEDDTEITDFDSDTWYETWNTNFIANAYDATKLTLTTDVYISHITEVDNSNTISERKTLIQQVRAGNYDSTYYLYTGATGSEDVNKENTTPTSSSYINGYGYILIYDSTTATLSWKEYGTLTQNTASTTLDSILEEANTHFNDNQFGMYYGMYYAYTGEDIITSSGMQYEKNHIYRIVLNDTNTAFVFSDSLEDGSKLTFTTKENASAALYEIIQGTIGADNVGDIFYLSVPTDIGDTYSQGYYKLTYDEDSDAYNLMKFADIDYDYSSLKLSNRRIYSENNDYLDQNDNNKNYGGTGGSFDVVVTAFIHEPDGSIVSRKFKVTVTG